MDTVTVYCQATGCSRDGHIARVRRPLLVTLSVEVYCGKCRKSRWYVVRADGSVTLDVLADVARSGVSSR